MQQNVLPFGELLQRLLIEADRTIDNREIGIALLCESVVLIFGAIEAVSEYYLLLWNFYQQHFPLRWKSLHLFQNGWIAAVALV